MSQGKDTTAQTTSQSVTQLPPWINQAAQQNYAYAQNVANRPLQQYQGQMVSDIGPQTQQAWNLAAGGGNAGQDQYNASQAGYLGVMGQQPQQVTAGQLANTNLQPYMSPFTQDVINKTLPIMQQNLALQQNQQQNAANSNNAFGGSRQGVQQGVTQAQGAMNMGQMAAQLNQANFGQAQAGATADINRTMAAAQANQQAQQNQGQLNLAAAGGLGTLGAQAQKNQLQQFGELAAAGQSQQEQAQKQINAQMQKFSQAWGYPTQQLGALQSALGMTPYGQAQQGQSTTTTQQSPDYINAIFSGLQTAGGLFGGGGPFASLLTGSDRRLKTDIKRVDTHPSGLPIYAYRYKGDPKSYPKVTGPMAEHVAQIAPHAVVPVGVKGRLAIDMSKLPGNDNMPLAASGRPPGAVAPGMGVIPGPLAAPGAAGALGALGAPMQRAPRGGMRKTRFPPIRGALGG